MATPTKKAAAKKPQDRQPKQTRRPAKAVSAAPAASKGRTVVMDVDGQRYELTELHVRPLDVMALRRETGYSLQTVFALLNTEPDIDLLAVILWLARRTNGEPTLTFTEVAESFSYDSDFVFGADGDGADSAPEA